MNSEEQKKIVFEDLKVTASKIGEHTRYIGFGIIALCFAIISAHFNSNSKLYFISVKIVLAAAACGLLTILFDYLHCLMGYLSSLKAKKNKNHGYKYDPSWLSYRLRNFFFILKQIFAILGSIVLIIGISALL